MFVSLYKLQRRCNPTFLILLPFLRYPFSTIFRENQTSRKLRVWVKTHCHCMSRSTQGLPWILDNSSFSLVSRQRTKDEARMRIPRFTREGRWWGAFGLVARKDQRILLNSTTIEPPRGRFLTVTTSSARSSGNLISTTKKILSSALGLPQHSTILWGSSLAAQILAKRKKRAV